MSKNIRNTSQGIINILTVDPSTTDWHTNGNPGTNGTTNYIGTSDNIPLLIATNGNTATGLKVSTKSQLEFLSGNIKIGTTAGNSITGVATGNIYIGNGCASNFSSGINNVMIGGNNGSAFAGTENNCIFIGANVGVISDYGGFSNNNGVTVIGDDFTQSRCFIRGIHGHTPGASLVVCINASGDMGTVVSSERFKTNIIDMGDASECIYQFQPKLFNYNDLPNEQSYGLIAEQVNTILPNIVTKDKNGLCEAIQYQYIEPMVLNEVIKQKQMIDALILRIEALENK